MVVIIVEFLAVGYRKIISLYSVFVNNLTYMQSSLISLHCGSEREKVKSLGSIVANNVSFEKGKTPTWSPMLTLLVVHMFMTSHSV